MIQPLDLNGQRMKNHQGARRLSRAVALTVTVAVCAAACGLSQSAKTTLGASSSGTVGTTSAASTGGGTAAAGTDTTTTTDPGTASGDGTSGAATTPSGTTPAGTTPTGTTPAGTTSAATTSGTIAAGTTPAGTTAGGTTPGTTPAGTTPGGTTPAGTAPGKPTTKPGTTTTPSKGTSPGTTAKGPATTTSAAPASANCTLGTGSASTGITASTINIGLHAPLTGTGTPFPNNSFVAGSKYFWMAPGHTVCGKNVAVDFQDDTYTPAGASQVCSGFAKTDFLAVGGAGTDQIQACATQPDIDSNRVPYLSAGVTTNGLTTLPNYFAVSLTYKQQSSILVKAAQAGGWATPKAASTGGQWAIVTANTANFDDATTGMTTALDAAGISYKVFRIDQSGNYQASAVAMGQTLALDGYKTIYTLSAPGYWVFETQGYYKQAPTGGVTWVGPGVSFTDFVVAQLACSGSPAISGHAYYLAPNPGVDKASDAFKSAAGSGADDIAWSLWGLDELIYQAFQKVAPGGLTRQNFIATLQNASLAGGVDPGATYNNSHFGGTAAWQQVIDCGKQESGQNQGGTWDTVGAAPLTP